MYTAQDGETYQLNLIDTPGHVDFSYEVSRSLASCEGALLVVDASQGVEAQTLANSYLAINHGLEIIPVINKIDLPSADIPRTKEMIESAVGLDATDAVLISAKTGQGVPDVLEAIVQRVPPPKGNRRQPAAGADFRFLVRHLSRRGRSRPRVSGNAAQGTENPPHVEWHDVSRSKPSACSRPSQSRSRNLQAGEVGFLVANIKNVADTKIGDTITDDGNPAIEPLPGFEEIKPMVFAGTLYRGRPRAHATARRARETAAQRLLVLLRAGKFGCAGLRISLRLSRPAAHGDHPGAPGARIQSRPDHHRARRALQDHQDRRRSDRGRQSLALAQSQRDRQNRRAGHPGHDPHQRRIRRRNSGSGRRKARQAEDVRVRQPPRA